MLDKQRDRIGAMAQLGGQFRLDNALRLVARAKRGLPVNPRELANAKAVVALAKRHGFTQ